MFLKLSFLFGMFCLFYGVGTQIVVPLLSNTPMFPLFRYRAKLERDAIDYGEALREQEVEAEVAELRHAALRGALSNSGKGEK